MTGLFAPALLAWEAQQVIALRLTKLALGGPAAAIEAGQMVTDKLTAGVAAAQIMSRAVMRGAHDGGSGDVVRMLRRRVRANKRRLSRKK